MGDFIDKHEQGDDWWANLCKKHDAENHWKKKTPAKKKAAKKKSAKKKK
tara:strand:- start:146 stop:292 length:147 start_codon:yes stop_codon:yes gene_type:complete